MPGLISTRSTAFFGWNLYELEQSLDQIKTQVQTEGLESVTSFGLNGKNAMMGQRLSLREWMIYLAEALQELDPVTYGYTARVSHASLGCGGYMQK